MENIVFLDRHAIRVPLRRPSVPHTWTEYQNTPPSEVVSRLQSATIAVINRISLTASAISSCPSLRLIVVAATGTENVDISACEERGIQVCNIRDWAVSVPEHIFALALALRRQLVSYEKAIRAGTWEKSENWWMLLDPLPKALAGNVLGIIGYGTLAQRVETIAEAFGMTVRIAERRGAGSIREGRTPFEEVIRQSDVLVLLCPLTHETNNLISAKELEMMKKDALLINCARGRVVNEEALAAALKKGNIAGAGVDVLSEEPPRNGNPLLDLHLPNLIVTPHMAWASNEALETLAEQLIGNIEAFVQGRPRNLVTA